MKHVGRTQIMFFFQIFLILFHFVCYLFSYRVVTQRANSPAGSQTGSRGPKMQTTPVTQSSIALSTIFHIKANVCFYYFLIVFLHFRIRTLTKIALLLTNTYFYFYLISFF